MNPQGQFVTRSAAARRIESELARYSISKVIRHLQNRQPLDGFEAEVEKELGGSQGTANAFGATVTVPWGALAASQRGLVTTNPSAGGSLVGVSVGPAADVLRPHSVAVRSGWNVLSDLASGALIPSVEEEVNFTWLNAESAAGKNSTPEVGLAQLTPKSASGLISYSGKLLRVGGAKMVDAFVKRRLLQAAGRVIDWAALSGRTGRLDAPENENAGPLGLCATPGVMTESTNNPDQVQSKLSRAMTFVANKIGSDDMASFIVAPMFREYVMPAPFRNGSDMDGGKLFGRVVHCSSGMSPLVGAYGDWSNAILALFGAGIELQIDPFTGFKNDIVTMRCIVSMDVAFPNPGAFALVSYSTP
jgi:hypothetical protein